ncbi:nuclear transport factor 2 family protein [Nocardia sp. NPDC051030]|uniref:nuclear transport factor 2 family protein n=1 Tax=Nocardia sp. NPDC051030 TaxID=3155162 RepID=UPI00344AB5CF
MNAITSQSPDAAPPSDDTGWPVAGLFLEALTNRDFPALTAYLQPNVRFRGLVPPGPFDTTGVDAAIDRFQHWFGGEDEFEVLEATAGRVGSRLYLRWRVRMHPPNTPDAARIAEQHVFATAGTRIESLDLLCSGWTAEHQPD